MLQGEHDRMAHKVSTLESALQFTQGSKHEDIDMAKVRRLNVELLEQNKELKDAMESMLECEQCEIWKRKTEKLASRYFETISGMKNEIKVLKKESNK